MSRRLIAALALSAFTSTAVATAPVGAAPSHRDLPESSLTPFTATYTVQRNSLRLGEMRAELLAPVEGVWRYRSETHSTGLIAVLRKISIHEESTFRIEDGHAVPLGHEYRMTGTSRPRDFALMFDWAQREVRGVVRGESVSEQLPTGAVDRHTTPLAIALAIAGGAELPARFVMVDRARIRHYDTVFDGTETLATDAGPIDTVRILLARVGEPSRRFLIWIAPSHGHLPVRIRSIDDDGDTVTLHLIGYQLP